MQRAEGALPRAGSWLVAFLLLLSFAAAVSAGAHQASATSPAVTGVGQWTQEGNYGSSSTSTSSPGVGVLGVQCVVSSGYVYCVGGQNPQGTDTSNVYYAEPSSSGTISGWTETTDYGAASGTSGSGGVGIEWPGCVTYEGYIYCVGGALSVSPYVTSKSYYAQLSSSGVGPWTETTDYAATSGATGSGGLPSFQLACVEDSGYIYCVGGSGGGPDSKVFYAQLSASGIGPWTETTDYGAASGTSGAGGVSIGATACVDDAGYVYCVGGVTTGFKPISDVFYAPVSSTGVGAWSEATDYGASSGSSGTGGIPIYGTNCVVYSGYVICIDGDTTGNQGTGNILMGKDEDIIAWVFGGEFVGDNYWEDCVEVYGYIFCWGAGSEDSFSAPIEPMVETTTSSSSSSTTSTTSTTTSTSATSASTASTTTSSTSVSTTSTTSLPRQTIISTTLLPLNIHVGGVSSDSAFFLSSPPPSGGTVTYYAYSGANCTGTKTALGTVSVPASGIPPDSPDSTFPTPGSYYFSASYSGDATDSPADSRCEMLTVLPTTSSTTGSSSTGTTTSGNDDALIGVGVVVVILLAAGGYIITRRRGTPGTTERPPPPPPPPPVTPPPGGPAVVAPLLIPPGGCEPGTTKTDESNCNIVTLYIISQSIPQIEGLYQATPEEIEAALEGLENALLAANVGQLVVGALTDPVGTLISQIASPDDAITGKGTDMATNALKGLARRLAGQRKFQGYLTVLYPQVSYRIVCVTTSTCKDGRWVVTSRELKMVKQGNPTMGTWQPQENMVNGADEFNRKMAQFATFCAAHNNQENAKVEACKKGCPPV